MRTRDSVVPLPPPLSPLGPRNTNSPTALLARKIRPAHVPHSGFPELAYSLRGPTSPHRSATSAIVVDSPPGMTSPSHLRSSSAVRTSRAVTPGRRRRAVECSRKEPCRARTPTVIGEAEGEEEEEGVGEFGFSSVVIVECEVAVFFREIPVLVDAVMIGRDAAGSLS